MAPEIPVVRDVSLRQAIGAAGDRIWSASAKSNDRLVILLHGLVSSPISYFGLLEQVHELTSADIFAARYEAGLFSDADPDAISSDLAERFEVAAAKYREIHFVAHSMGAAFLREAYVKALQRPESALRTRHDAGAVRMTFLASSSRGYKPTDWKQAVRLGFLQRWFWLTLIVTAVAWALRSFATGATFADPLGTTWVQSIAVVVSVALAALLIATAIFNGPIMPTAMDWLFGSAAVWMIWAACGSPIIQLIATFFQTIGTLWCGLLLARRRSAAWAMAAVILVAGLLAPWMAVYPQAACLALLSSFLPLFIYPMQTRLLLEHVLKGAPWITRMRQSWIETFTDTANESTPQARKQTSAADGLKPPPIVHLFGEEDRLVGDDDHVELHQADNVAEVAIRGVLHNDFQIRPSAGIRAKTTARSLHQERVAPVVSEALRLALTQSPNAILADLKRDSRDGANGFRIVRPIREGR
jgi:pimeloyl-ACP methyl ester carboxylesterase